jgi:hypothetical protein
MKMNSIRLKVVYIETNKLKPNPKNPRLIKDPDFSRLCQSLREDPEFFEARPILCNRDFQVFAGTQRLKAAQEIGLKEVPVIMMDNPGLEARRMLKDNLSAGTWDYAALEDSFDLDFLREVGFGDVAVVADFARSHRAGVLLERFAGESKFLGRIATRRGPIRGLRAIRETNSVCV